MRNALVSLANSIDCAQGCKEWKERYSYKSGASEVRGMLFVYNHDGDFDQSFMMYSISLTILKLIRRKEVSILTIYR